MKSSDAIALAKRSLYLSGARVWDDLHTFDLEQSERCQSIGADLLARAQHAILVGSGGSYASLQTAKYVLDRIVGLPVEVFTGDEMVWRQSRRLNPDTLVVLATYSGETADIVAALGVAKERGAPTVGIVGKADSTIGREADAAIAYECGSIYELPIVALLRMAAGSNLDTVGQAEMARIDETLGILPSRLEALLTAEEDEAEGRARQLLWAHHLYVLGAGPLSPLAYKVALTVVMENIRIGATYCDASEFRHGPAEALERLRPAMMFLVGTDESRPRALAALEFCRQQGASTLVYDAADYGTDIHPPLTPLVMNSFTQWFTAYSAILRGIMDLDDRVFMGHGVLNASGAQWP